MRTYSVWETDYVVIYVGQVQRRRYEWLLEEYFYNPDAEPEHVVNLHGVDYAWIYPNEHYLDPIEHLNQVGQLDAQDCLLVNGNSLLAEHYQGELPVFTFEGHWNPAAESHVYWDTGQVGDVLDKAGQACRQIWYARYPDYEDDAYVRLLEGRGLLIDQASFPHVDLLHYRLTEPRLTKTVDLQFEPLRLMGYGTTDPPPAWGRDGGLFMAWEITQPVKEDYSAFLHVYDASGQRIALGDSLLVNQDLEPTSQWLPGERNAALYHLPIPPGTPPGRYELALGVYELETGHRLRLTTGETESQETSARLQVEIGTPDGSVPIDELHLSHPVDREVASGLMLMGYDVEPKTVLAEGDMGVRLTWQAVETLPQDYRLELGLRDREGQLRASLRSSMVETEYPTSKWHDGEVLQEWYHLPVDESVPTGEMTLTLNLIDERGKSATTEPLALGEVWVQSTQPSVEAPQAISHPSRVNFGDRVTLLGYDVSSSVRAGEELALTVYWEAQGEITQSYKVFVHVYDGQGNILAQQDRVPGLGARPTTTWQAGEVVADRLLVPVDPGSPAGAYDLAVGLYDPETGDRLPVYGTDGERLEDDRFLLGQVDVRP